MLNYQDYTKKCTDSKDSCVSYKAHTGRYFRLSSGSKTIAMSFEPRIIHGQLPFSLIFAQGLLRKISLSSLAYGIVSITSV